MSAYGQLLVSICPMLHSQSSIFLQHSSTRTQTPPSPGPAENCIVTPLRRDRCPLGVLCAEPPVIRRAGCRNTTVIGRATGLTAQQISSLVYRQINATHLLRNHPSIARLSRHSQLSFSCRKCNRLLLKLQFVSVSWSTVLHRV